MEKLFQLTGHRTSHGSACNTVLGVADWIGFSRLDRGKKGKRVGINGMYCRPSRQKGSVLDRQRETRLF